MPIRDGAFEPTTQNMVMMLVVVVIRELYVYTTRGSVVWVSRGKEAHYGGMD